MNDYKDSDQYKGWLYKWTNYLRGYQKRWFVVQNGLLSYYRNQAEMSHTCRGTINLTNATIDTYDSCTFVISNSGNQTFHLRTYSELEMKRWVTALSLAKAKAISLQEAVVALDDDSDMNMDESSIHTNGRSSDRKCKSNSSREEIDEVVHTINRKIEDLSNCEPLLERHGDSLFKSLNELEHIHDPPEAAQRLRIINEKAVHFRVASSAMINACTEFGRYVSDHAKKWQRMLQFEHDQRLRLEAMVEELAKQHRALEKKVEMKNQVPLQTNNALARNPQVAYTSGDSDEDDFYDALDEPETVFNISLSRSPCEPREGAATSSQRQCSDSRDEYQHDYESSDDSEREDQTEIKVIAKQRRTDNKGNEFPRSSIEKNHRRSKSTDSTASKKNLTVQSSGTGKRQRRKAIPDRPNYSVNLWSIMKNCIGKELTKIPMPVNFSEPLSMLQRLSEDFEYSACLDKAALSTDPIEQMAYVAAFTASAYSTTTVRTGKPFNPLLGETFECDRTEDMGWRSIAEQVSHHPPTAALHCESQEWETWQEFTASSKFRGKYLGICPLGIAHVTFKKTNGHYTWRKVNTTVHNIIVGRLWIDNHGEMDIINHTTGEKCHLVYKPYSYFSKDSHRRVNGVIYNPAGEPKYVLNGTWDDHLEGAHVISSGVDSRGKPVLETGPNNVLWRRNPPLPGAERMYNFTQFAIELNELEEGVCPTDSRLRPDQRHMELGEWDEANKEKVRLEEKQRAKRRLREKEEAEFEALGKQYPPYEPVWFKLNTDSVTGNPIHLYNKKYWDCKAKQQWNECPDLY